MKLGALFAIWFLIGWYIWKCSIFLMKNVFFLIKISFFMEYTIGNDIFAKRAPWFKKVISYSSIWAIEVIRTICFQPTVFRFVFLTGMKIWKWGWSCDQSHDFWPPKKIFYNLTKIDFPMTILWLLDKNLYKYKQIHDFCHIFC